MLKKTKKQIPLALFFSPPEKMSPKISPNGKHIAYLVSKDNVLNIAVRTIGEKKDRLVTRERRSITNYQWISESRLIYLQDSDGDENWHIYLVDLEQDRIIDLTPFQKVKAKIICADYNFPNQLLIGLNLRDPHCFDAYKANLKTGKIKLDTKNPGNVIKWIVDSKFQIRGAQCVSREGIYIHMRENTKSRWKILLKFGQEDMFSCVVLLKEDTLYLEDSRSADTIQLTKFNMKTSKLEVLASDLKYDINEILIHPKTKQVQAVSFLKERKYWKVLDKEIKKDFEIIKQSNLGDFSICSRDVGDKIWILGFNADNKPGSYYIYNRRSKKIELLFSARPKLEKYTLAKMNPITFKARDGLVLRGYLTLPLRKQAKNLPLVLRVHGGPSDRDIWNYTPEVQWLANRGYACLQINFRGSKGYGKTFLNAGNREWGRRMHTDLIDGVNWAIKKGIADPKRIAIYGQSYGGYAALVGAAFTPNIFACAVDIYGISNLNTFMKSTPKYWILERKLFEQQIGTEKKFLESRSPLFKANQIKIPLFIAQGANDVRVKPKESEQIVRSLRDRGIRVEYLLFPDEGHGFLKFENRMLFYSQVESFLDKYIGKKT